MRGFHRASVRCVMALLLALATLPLPAATSGYIIEVLVFENGAGNDDGERWPDRIDVEFPEDAVDLANNNADFTELARDQLQLAGAAKQLSRSGRHHLLLHKAWQQPALPKGKGKPVQLLSPTGQIDGTLRLESGRYLHVYLDLVYGRSIAFGGVRSFQLKQQRRVRLEELHYFDHPRFGALVTVRAAEPG